MTDEFIKQHDEAIRADERAKMAKEIDVGLGMIAAGTARLKALLSSEPSAHIPKRGRKAKAQAAGPLPGPEEIRDMVIGGLKAWDKPERPTAGELAKFIELPTPPVSKALARLAKDRIVNFTGAFRARRYILPIAAARELNSDDHAEA
jgi:hypothetical protein